MRYRAFGLEFCGSGNHAATDAYEWQGYTWCPKHRPPGGPPDPLLPGYCEWSRGHFAKDGVRWMPGRGKVKGRYLCSSHWAEFVQEVVRRGFWHKT